MLLSKSIMMAFSSKTLNHSQIMENLKFLKLSTPTSQKQIKKKYREMAKMYHPDYLKQKSTKTTVEYFSKLTSAYNELKDLTDEQLKKQIPMGASGQEYNINTEQGQRRYTQEEKKRRQTYEYFNRGPTKPSAYAKSKQRETEPEKKPLYKTVPEFFIGSFLVVIIFGEYIFRSAGKTHTQLVKKQQQDKDFKMVFTGLDGKSRFNKVRNEPPLPE